MDANYYIKNNPFKKEPKSAAQIKWSIGAPPARWTFGPSGVSVS